MSQQLVNGSYRKSDVTFTFRMSDRYAVVSEPFNGKHKKPQDVRSRFARKRHWMERKDFIMSDVTFTFRMSDRYAVVSEPFNGKHKKPQDVHSRLARKQHWRERNDGK